MLQENGRIVIMKKFRETDDDLFVKKTGLREIRSMRVSSKIFENFAEAFLLTIDGGLL